MSKSKKLLILLFIILAAILIISFFAVKALCFGDKIVNSEKLLIDSTTLLQYETEKGQNIDMAVSGDIIVIGEKLYQVRIILNRQDDGECYGVENVDVKLAVDSSVEIVEAFYSANGPDYEIPEVDYSEGTKTVRCSSDRGYLDFRLILSGDKAEEALLNVGYDIAGKQMYSFNRFYGFEENIELHVR